MGGTEPRDSGAIHVNGVVKEQNRRFDDGCARIVG